MLLLRILQGPKTQSQETPVAEERELAPVIETVVANSDVLTPYFIFQGSVHLERWYRIDGLLEDYRIAVAPKWYITDQIAIDWLKHFISCTRDSTEKGDERLFIPQA